MTPQIIAHLSNDSRLQPLVNSIQLEPIEGGEVYERLLRAILYQQLSGASASAIHRRFVALFPDGYPYPELLLALDESALRACGLSRQKSEYMRNVADFFQREDKVGFDWSSWEDEQIISYLTQIKGVGRWTVEMILMFTLNRPDVMPLDDYGIQQAMQGLYQFEAKGRALKQKMEEISKPWQPWRTYACWYLWRWKDGSS
ncbi:MAG: DNA-3-methyladenine glycosylase 2 family protein [Saprospiraceae bacterium]|jgi:DNA-3-methyladenine glycosylase II|nr:DNA-3-methyladenine glycosylase 2 family protein [Saprospiraceae bacterium]